MRQFLIRLAADAPSMVYETKDFFHYADHVNSDAAFIATSIPAYMNLVITFAAANGLSWYVRWALPRLPHEEQSTAAAFIPV